MAKSAPAEKVTLLELRAMAARGEKIAMLAVYDFPTARLADQAGLDILLIGDSAAMVVFGHESTTKATVAEIEMLTGAVARAAKRALVVADMPFGAYQVSDEEAVTNAIRLVKAGAHAVKVEGAGTTRERVRAIVGAGVPVMGHIGLTPQTAVLLSGFRAQGRDAEAAKRLLREAHELEESGCFAIVLEAVPATLAAKISAALSVPTIGIGAGARVDGQVMVFHDLVGYDPEGSFRPRFVKRFGEVGQEIAQAFADYVAAVKDGSFPSKEHEYSMPADELARLE